MTKSKAQREQSARFIEAARDHGAAEDPEAFERLFAKVVPPKKAGDVASEKPKVAPPQKRPYRRRR